MPTTAVADFAFSVVLPPDQFEALAQRVADLLDDGRPALRPRSLPQIANFL
jgi:hypothetical protein